MSASLVGSEMCIRDSSRNRPSALWMRASPDSPRMGVCSRGSRLGAGEQARAAAAEPAGD
eukprot:14592582-Alexandrium_andersonii.AAC.1